MAAAIFLPSFVLMRSVLPMFERVRTLLWTRATMQGVGPAVLGVLAVSLAMRGWRIGVITLMTVGAVLGILRNRLLSLPGIRATF